LIGVDSKAIMISMIFSYFLFDEVFILSNTNMTHLFMILGTEGEGGVSGSCEY